MVTKLKKFNIRFTNPLQPLGHKALKDILSGAATTPKPDQNNDEKKPDN